MGRFASCFREFFWRVSIWVVCWCAAISWNAGLSRNQTKIIFTITYKIIINQFKLVQTYLVISSNLIGLQSQLLFWVLTTTEGVNNAFCNILLCIPYQMRFSINLIPLLWSFHEIILFITSPMGLHHLSLNSTRCTADKFFIIVVKFM